MKLSEHIEALPLLRSWNIPDSTRNVCCVVMWEDLNRLKDFAAENPALKIRLLLIPDLPDNGPKQIHLTAPEGTSVIPVGTLRDANAAPHWKKVILCRPDPFGAETAAMLCRCLTLCGVRAVYLYAGHSRKFGMRPALPDFYHRREAELRKVYGLLANDDDRETFAARIKALMTGDAGYLPLSSHREYHHPLVQPEHGDIMIDGGVSDMVGAQERFAQSVGGAGHVFGFEPIPSMAAVARRELARFPQYHLQTAGLGRTRGQLRFTFLRDSSHISTDSDEDDSVLCDMTSIDDFVEEHRLDRVNCIKLDVEGAEPQALSGGEKTILKHRPKLIICLYHKPSHMIDIPLFIHNIAPEYTMHVAHSSCLFTDTVLYARIP